MSLRVALAVAVGAAAVATVTLYFVWPHEASSAASSPLGPGFANAPDVRSPLFYDVVSPPFGEGKRGYVLRFRPHERFRFGFVVRNQSRSALRIEGLAPHDTGELFRFTRLRFQHRPNTYLFAGATLEPLTIPPDGHGYVIATIETGPRCNMVDGGVQGFDSVVLEYSQDGSLKTQGYSLPMVIGMVCSNPQAVVDRMFGP